MSCHIHNKKDRFYVFIWIFLFISFFPYIYIYLYMYMNEWIATFWYDWSKRTKIELNSFCILHFDVLYTCIIQQKFSNTLLNIKVDMHLTNMWFSHNIWNDTNKALLTFFFYFIVLNGSRFWKCSSFFFWHHFAWDNTLFFLHSLSNCLDEILFISSFSWYFFVRDLELVFILKLT